MPAPRRNSCGGGASGRDGARSRSTSRESHAVPTTPSPKYKKQRFAQPEISHIQSPPSHPSSSSSSDSSGSSSDTSSSSDKTSSSSSCPPDPVFSRQYPHPSDHLDAYKKNQNPYPTPSTHQKAKQRSPSPFPRPSSATFRGRKVVLHNPRGLPSPMCCFRVETTTTVRSRRTYRHSTTRVASPPATIMNHHHHYTHQTPTVQFPSSSPYESWAGSVGFAPPPPGYSYGAAPPVTVEAAPPQLLLTAPTAPVITDPKQIDATANFIADIVAPAVHREKKRIEIADSRRREWDRYAEKEHARYEAQKDRQLTEQAWHNVQARNRYYEHVAEKKRQEVMRIDEHEQRRRERRRSEGSYHSHSSDRGRGRYSTDTLVVVDQPGPYEVEIKRETELRCGNCRNMGHLSHQCGARGDLVVVVENSERRRRRRYL